MKVSTLAPFFAKREVHSFFYTILLLLPCTCLGTHYLVLALELIGQFTLAALQKPTLENISQLPVNIFCDAGELN